MKPYALLKSDDGTTVARLYRETVAEDLAELEGQEVRVIAAGPIGYNLAHALCDDAGILTY